MKILAIETSTLFGGVAIMDESDGLIAEARLNVKTTHSERLMTVIHDALRQSYLKISDIDVFGVSIGPGSFTGLRIGLSTAKGFSYATKKPIVSVPSLEAFAWNFPYSAYPVCPMFDARKKEIYAAVFRWKENDFERVVDEASFIPSALLERLEGPVLFAGEGALLYQETIRRIAGENALFPPPHTMVPSPANVAYLCLRKALRRDFSEPLSLVPLYIRKSEAEVKMHS